MAAPTVTSVEPNTGETYGGIAVTVFGTGLTGATEVNFGAYAATQVEVVDDTQITCVNPEGQAPGVVDVTVTTGQGTSATAAADGFTYTAPLNEGDDEGNQFEGKGPGTWQDEVTTEFEIDPMELAVIPGQTGTQPVPETDIVGETVPNNVGYLRLLVQEVIAPEGTDTDTMFLDENLVQILNRSANIMSYAAWTAWTVKAGALLVLTDRNDGLSEKKLSQAAVAAQKQAAYWQPIAMADLKSMGRCLAPGGVVFRPYDAGMDNLWNQVWDASHIDRFWLPWNVIEG